jgi:hypothetical protein
MCMIMNGSYYLWRLLIQIVTEHLHYPKIETMRTKLIRILSQKEKAKMCCRTPNPRDWTESRTPNPETASNPESREIRFDPCLSTLMMLSRLCISSVK